MRWNVGFAPVIYPDAHRIHSSAGSLAPADPAADDRDYPNSLRDNLRHGRWVFRRVRQSIRSLDSRTDLRRPERDTDHDLEKLSDRASDSPRQRSRRNKRVGAE